jgi:arylsulfatase A-like enzyme
MRARHLLVLLLVSLGCDRGPPRPNIVLVVWDTCRGDRVSVNGYERPTTPRLEALAKEGTTFRRCYSPSPWTPPAHASLFTGLLPRNHGLREGRADRVEPGLPLLAETLRAAGYETACAVANPQISDATGLDAGFDTVLRCYGEPEAKGDGAEVLGKLRAFSAARRASGGGRPLFLFVNLMEPHLPYACDAASVAAVRGDGAVNGARKAAALVTDARANDHLYGVNPLDATTLGDLSAAYDGAVRAVDRVTGEILDLLREDGLLGNALVAVCGDHGENLGEHGDVSHLMSVRDPVLHVPLVLRWPGRFEGGRVVDEQVRLQDLYPTLLAAARADAPGRCGGDAASLLETPLRPRTLVAEYGPALDHVAEVARVIPDAPRSALDRLREALVAVREPPSIAGARKYVSVFRHGDAGEAVLVREELFDLAADPGELRNLLPAERATADRLREVGGSR